MQQPDREAHRQIRRVLCSFDDGFYIWDFYEQLCSLPGTGRFVFSNVFSSLHFPSHSERLEAKPISKLKRGL